MTDPMSEEELGLIACAIRYGRFPPRPEHLAACHRLAERGWLERSIIGDELLFELSEVGAAALELGVPIGDARQAMN